MAISKNSDQIIIVTSQNLSLYNINTDCFIGSWLFDIAVSNVSKVDLCNNYIAYVHDSEIYVIYFNVSKPKYEEMNLTSICEKTLFGKSEKQVYDKISRFTNERSSFLSSPTQTSKKSIVTSKEDKYYTKIEFNEHNEAISVPFADLSSNFHTNTPINLVEEFLGPIRDIHRIQINVFEGYVLEVSSILLYKKLETPIHSLSFYIPEKSDDTSKVHIFFSTYQTGYSYYLPYTSKTELLCEYVYPNESLRAVLHNNYLFIVTEDGLEYYLLRYHDSTHCSFIDNQSTPIDFGYSIALFLGLYQASPGNNNILLLAKTTEADILRKRDASIGLKSEYSIEESSNIVGWSIYVMTLKDPKLILEEFYNITKQSIQNQSSFSHQMLFELYSYIYSSLISFPKTSENKELISHFNKIKKEAFTLLGEYYFKKKDFITSSHFFSYSDTSINQTSRRFLEESMNKKNSDMSNQALHGLHNYLTKVLLDFKMIHLLDPDDTEFSDNLISVYHQHSPGILGQIILESYVTSYNLSNCLKLLVSARTQMKLALQEITKEERGLYTSSSKNEQHFWELTLAICFIYSIQEEFDTANDYLEMLPDTFLVSYISAHTNLLIPPSSLMKTYNPSTIGMTESSLVYPFDSDESNNPSSFAKCLALYRPWILLEILVSSSNLISEIFAEKCLDLTHNPEHFKMIYYETLLLDNLDPNYCVNLAELYIHILLNRNERSNEKINQRDENSKLSSIYEEFHQNFLIDERFLWLDLIPPFKNYQNESESITYGVNQEYFYVQKLQGLICHIRSDKQIIHNLYEVFKINIETENQLFTSIEILTQAIKNEIEVPFREIIKKYPLASLEFSKTFCETNEQWKELWNILLSECKISANSDIMQKEVCSSFIDYLARNLDSLTFISLIPDDGNSAYFLPYIELNLHFTESKKIIKDMFKYSN